MTAGAQRLEEAKSALAGSRFEEAGAAALVGLLEVDVADEERQADAGVYLTAVDLGYVRKLLDQIRTATNVPGALDAIGDIEWVLGGDTGGE